MRICARCGESNQESARFCQACGAALGETSQQLRKTVTSLFADLVGSTSLAESLADPEAFHDVVTRYSREMSKVIERHGGTVEKFAGDAIMATFGVPRAHEDDALRAVRAALEMRQALSSLNAELQARWGITLQIRVGINSGEVLTGDSIAGEAMVLGDAVNVAARLEQTAEPGEIILGEKTVRLVGAGAEVEGPRLLPLKGKSGSVAAYRLVRLVSDPLWAGRRFPRSMVGRRSELQSLRDAYRRVVRDERGESLVVVGPPGIGKSRLVAAFHAEVEGEATIHSANCPSYGERTTFWPLGEIIRAQAGVHPSDGPSIVESKLLETVDAVVVDRGEQLWIAPHLVSLAGLATTHENPQAGDSFSAWRRFFERLAGARPLILVIEDLHWAGDPLLDFVGLLAGCEARILAVGTARADIDDDRLTRTAASLFRLDLLTPDETGALVENVATASLPERLRNEVVARSGGNPLFAEALVTVIAERGLEKLGDEVPDTIEALVSARLDALSPSLHSLLLTASVIGSSIRAEALAAMLGVDAGTVEGGINDLVRGEFLQTAAVPEELEFWHGLVREVAYRQIPRADRSAKHRAFARWLEGRSGDEAADLLAHHFGRAFELAVDARESEEIRRDLAERAFRYGVLAAGGALRAADPASASTLLGRTVKALREIAIPDLALVGEAGELLVTLGRWGDAIGLLAPFADSGLAPILRALGVATCKLHRDDPHGAEYRHGQNFLVRAADMGDRDAIASLAGTWKGVDERRVWELYRRASEMDPADPYPLGNLLDYEIQAAGDLSPVERKRDRIAGAIERCRAQVAVGQNLPWAHYDFGKLHVLLGLPYQGLEAYAKAVDLSPAAFMLETSLASLRRLSAFTDLVPGLTWSQDLLVLALRAKFGEGGGEVGISPPVVILAGGTSAEQDEWIGNHGSVLLEAFRDVAGTVVSGGTGSGVSGLAGELGIRSPDRVRTIGYMPRAAPGGTEADERYHEVRRTEGRAFSPLEPLVYWNDLLRAGIRPDQVKLVGVGGGDIASAEFAIALALGATVGIIRDSGGAADEFLTDSHWGSTARLVSLPVDVAAVRSFITASGRHARKL